MVFNLLDYEDFIIHYVNDTIPNLPAGYLPSTQDKRNVCIIAIIGENPTTVQSVLDELNCFQTPHGKSKVKISLCRRKSYQRTDIEDIHFIFDQVRPVVSHIEVRLLEKPLTSKKIDESLKGSQRQLCKEALFMQY